MPNRLIEIALAAVLTAAATGQLPQLVHAIRIAQLQLLKESQASHWGHPMLLKVRK